MNLFGPLLMPKDSATRICVTGHPVKSKAVLEIALKLLDMNVRAHNQETRQQETRTTATSPTKQLSAMRQLQLLKANKSQGCSYFIFDA